MTRDADRPLPSKRAEPLTDSPLIQRCRSPWVISLSFVSPHLGTMRLSSSDLYPAVVLGFFAALLSSHSPATTPKVTAARGLTYSPFTTSAVILSRCDWAASLSLNTLVCSWPVSSTQRTRQRATLP